MKINCINNIGQFEGLRTAWETVYAVDTHATIFVSWAWLRGWLETAPSGWVVLAAQPDRLSLHVAFLALTTDLDRNELRMAGDPFADHIGFVCLPEYEDEAMEALAVFVQALKWNRFRMRDVLDPRLDSFLAYFPQRRFSIKRARGSSCPYISLPGSWESYLSECLGSRTRKRLRRSMRKVDGLSGFRITQAQDDNIRQQIDVALGLYELQWGSQPGQVLDRFRDILCWCYESNRLWVVILWDGETPVAADISFADRQRNTMSAFIGGWDAKYADLSVGAVLIGHGIRYAIENGFREFDFLRGDEDYKFSFCVQERFNTNITIDRLSLSLTIRKAIRSLRRFMRHASSVPSVPR